MPRPSRSCARSRNSNGRGGTASEALVLHLSSDPRAHSDELIVTKRGRPVAKVVPVESPEELRARARDDLRGSITYLVDDDELLEPIAAEWQALG